MPVLPLTINPRGLLIGVAGGSVLWAIIIGGVLAMLRACS